MSKFTAALVALLSACVSAQDGFRLLGRVNPATKELTWPGTGLAFNFTGTMASIGIQSSYGPPSADLFVDDEPVIDISAVSGSSIDIPTQAPGTHSVVFRKRSEAYTGSIFLGEVTTDGQLGTVTAPTRQIEIIGDSISVGYGLDGVAPCVNTAAVEDNPKTYEALAADALNADYHVIAWSGKGVVRNYVTTTPDTSPIMPEYFTRYGANDADNSYTFPADWNPQAVVINLGTNDFSYIQYDADGTAYAARPQLDAKTYTDAMVSFVKTVQMHYKDAEFFLMSSPMLSDTYPTAQDMQKTTQVNSLKDAVSQIGDKAHYVDWPTQGPDTGCDSHPNAATHAAEATVLASAISSVLGW